jgi:4-hydroxy-tetrahydrodipicolinate reductase
MRRLVATTVEAAEDLALTGCFDPAGGDPIGPVAISDDPAALAACDVVVEFSNPAVVMANLARWHDAGSSAVVGTSGFDDERVAAVRALWIDATARCCIVPNFSLGAVLMMKMASLAAPFFPAADIIELHHDHKVDAPSGTALATARLMAEAGGRSERAVESDEVVAGAMGARVGGVPIHSVRLPGLVAHQQVTFGAPGETLTIRHDTMDRESFMPGVLLAIRGVATLEQPVTVGLEPLLGLD